MNRFTPVAAVICSMLLFTACATAPVNEVPVQSMPTPEAFVAQDILQNLSGVSEAGVASVRWWEGFNDPILDQLIQTSLETNFQIAAAAASVREAKALLALSDTGNSLLVELDGQLTGQRTDRSNSASNTSNSTGSNSRNERNAVIGLGFALPVDLAGKVDQEVRAAAANLMAVQAGLRAQIISTSTDVAQEYLRLRGNQKQLAMLRDSVALQEKTLAIVQARFESGLSPELDVRRAETSVETLRASVAPLEQALRRSMHQLATLAGQFPGAYDSLLTPVGDLPRYSLGIPPRLPLQVLQARPDVQLAQARFAQAAAEVGVAQADFYPSLDLMANIQVGSSVLNSNPATGILIASLSAVLDQVIYDGGARDARLDAAKARAEIALADYEQVLRTVTLDVENALSAIQASVARQTALNKAVVSSKRSFEQADALYQLGLVSFLDVVDAQRVYANAEQALATEQTSYATLVASLFRALGVQA
ncbi:NodT family efflux transporter outer membrane factor (OMF) lipoprotein [Limnobacter thiooxidans]|uniref:Efflux transporter outer membrane subunit n=1 Tax=Limnobacter thiooxidans TaxID=131080 RepID=A0AA86M8L4_9BURK|nr:NodT family efflux transporter outer membrane factor (OMF) lipoprotein [Limnobacter thiooxidans]BET26159.1 efflux transporter outer membrane subunit [Limnobacter thiooxidans]